ncbi:MAG: 50S ribosomal protein L16 [Candidatus Nanohaloarchaea archaeon]|nr:50S ribosomal protein L16 [Candidatus Nanohaloarchaea archaeon]
MSLRPGRIYRDVPGQPYTRVSRTEESGSYIKGAPAPKITIFENGSKGKDFDKKVVLTVEDECCIRSNALESSRVAANSYMKRNLTLEDYHLKIKPYPHHVLRHHPLAGVAQADRYYEGMRKPFGRPIGRAAIVDKEQAIIEIKTDEDNVDIAKKAAERAGMKIPTKFRVKVRE